MMRSKARYFIIGLFILALSGCESKGFRAERQMWQAKKQAEAILKNPKGTPPYQLARAQDAYRAIIKKYPGSLFAARSQFNIGHLYLAVGDFNKARAEYKKLSTKCDKLGNICAEADFAIGRSFEVEGRWGDALAYYRRIIKSYPLSTRSLDLPIYIIRHYQRAGDEKNAKLFADEGVAYYLDLKSKSNTDKGDYILQSIIVRCYTESGQWEDAIDALNKLIRDYPKQNPEEAYFLKALIYSNRLKDKDKARAELLNIIKFYPRSKLARQAEAFLKKFR